MNNYWVDTEFFDRYKLEKGWQKARLEEFIRRRLLELKIEEVMRQKRIIELRNELQAVNIVIKNIKKEAENETNTNTEG